MKAEWLLAHLNILSGTVIKTFNIIDVDPGDHIRVFVTDPITTDYVTFNQTLGNTITVDFMLRQILDRDRVCLFSFIHT